MNAGIHIQGLTKTYRAPGGPVPAVRGIDVSIAPGETVALLGPNGAGKSTTIDMMLGLAEPDAGTRRRCSARRRARPSTPGWSAAMLQTGALIRDLTVRELIAMMASLYPDPLDVDEVIELTGLTGRRRAAHPEALGRPDPARALRDRARRPTRRCWSSTSRRWRWTSRARRDFWADDARVRRPRQDRPVRHPLPRGGRRQRRPRRDDGPRADRRRRPDDRDQGARRPPHDPRHAGRGRPPTSWRDCAA